jgi:hypothetical protein
MRSFFIAVTALMLLATGAAQAKVFITIDKDAQMMTVAVDGSERYHWPVSTGIPSYETPNGSFRTFRMEEDHFSKEFDDAPMPHSIFFTKIGQAASAPQLPMAACGCRAPTPRRFMRWSNRKACSTPP